MTFEEIAKKAMDLTQAESEAVAKKVITEYETALKAMNEQLKEVYATVLSGVKPEDYFNQATKYNRLTMLIEDLQKKYLATAKTIGKETMQAAESAIANSYYRNTYAINWASAQGVFVEIPQSVIDVSVYGTQEAWAIIKDSKTFGVSEEYLPQSGTLLEQLLVKRNAEVIAQIEQTVRLGLIAGDSYVKTAKKIKAIMETDAWKALRIVNTETHRNMMAGQYANAQAMRRKGLEARRKIV